MVIHITLVKMRFFNFLLIILTYSAVGQNAQDKLNKDKVNVVFLEQLLLNEVNSIRFKNNGTILLPDSVLYQASKNHAEYLGIQKKLTHFQKENKPLKDPQLRAEYFGAHDFYIGENILEIPVGHSIKMDKVKISTPSTYYDFSNLAWSP